MMKRRVLVGLWVLGMSFPLLAEQPLEVTFSPTLNQPEIFNTVDGLTLIKRLPILNFLDGTRLLVSSPLGRMGRAPLNLDSINYVTNVDLPEITVSPAEGPDGKDFVADGKDSPADVKTAQSSSVYYGGELGLYFGHSSGKFGGDEFGSYLVGGVGDDKFTITVGAGYQESNNHIPRGRH
jgi:hypothetical protein